MGIIKSSWGMSLIISVSFYLWFMMYMFNGIFSMSLFLSFQPWNLFNWWTLQLAHRRLLWIHRSALSLSLSLSLSPIIFGFRVLSRSLITIFFGFRGLLSLSHIINCIIYSTKHLNCFPFISLIFYVLECSQLLCLAVELSLPVFTT